MQAQSEIKFRHYPSGERIPVYSQWIGHRRFIYDGKADEDRYFLTLRNHALSLTGQHTPIDQQCPDIMATGKCPSAPEQI